MTQGSRPALTRQLDWGQLAPLTLRARSVAEGAYTGAHRSARKGSGVEFGGHRDYVPGDDLRWLDRHALMRHARLVIREFETETERVVHFVVDATRSMGFRSEQAPGAKLAYAALLAAALGFVASRERDPIGLSWLGGEGATRLRPRAGSEAFERLVNVLEEASAQGADGRTLTPWSQVFGHLGDTTPRGSVIVLFSDLLDAAPEAAAEVARVCGRGRRVIVLRVLDPLEATFPFDGPLRLRDVEDSAVVETDGARARRGYLEALDAILHAWRAELAPRGGEALSCVTTDDPVQVVRTLLAAIAGRHTGNEPASGAPR